MTLREEQEPAGDKKQKALGPPGMRSAGDLRAELGMGTWWLGLPMPSFAKHQYTQTLSWAWEESQGSEQTDLQQQVRRDKKWQVMLM